MLQGTNRAGDNCDSWTLCALLKQLALANPEYDFLSQTHVVERDSLLHHCTLFNCMRPRYAPAIQELPGYDVYQDSWAKRHDGWTPGNTKELLETLQTMVEEAGIDLDSILEETGIDLHDEMLAATMSAFTTMTLAE